MRNYFVYIMSNLSRNLYIGMTNDLERRVWEHKTGYNQGFTSKYNIRRLVYIETYPDPNSAIAREKQLKGWSRPKKLAWIMSVNPLWNDLSDDWYDESIGNGDRFTPINRTTDID